ncbi:MAG TPA: TIGR03619 family F420-dependent LLM class oxidoreductase [Geobacterales bacterium]|nr:TIGR03619 family F420-dependent LLM class oxidoreductase [Geobacterales bacterium]
MKFGVSILHTGQWASKEAIEKTAEQAERLEFNSIWVSDHIITPTSYGKSYGYIYESIVTLSYLASLTENVILGSSVIVLPIRDPVILAKQLASLDLLSQGRLIVGFGSGWLKEEFEFLGKEFINRGKIMDEWIMTIKRLWSSERIVWEGKEMMFEPKPLQKGGPKIIIGGNSKKAIIRACKLGDGWNPVGISPKILSKKIAFMRKMSNNYRKLIFLRIGCLPDIENAYKTKKSDYNYYLSGSLRAIAEDLEKYNELGVDHLIAYFGAVNLENYLERMRKFKDIMRSFQN